MAMFNYFCDEVKKTIEEVSLNYPQLTTYEKEWLFFNKYGYIPGIPVNLEYATVETNDRATVYNTIPFNYKSAILKGSTKYRDIDTGEILDTFDETKNLELVSVKMPVLTTMGKNLYNKEESQQKAHSSVEFNGDKISFYQNRTEFELVVFGGYKEETQYTIQFEGLTNNPSFLIVYTDLSYKRLMGNGFRSMTSDEGKTVSRIHAEWSDGRLATISNLQIEEGIVATDYRAHESNILSLNAEVNLRGIGNVHDELNLLTGELTQRVGEVVLNGRESYSVSMSTDTQVLFMCNDIIGRTNGKIIGQLVNGVSSLSLSGTSGKVIITTQKSQISNVSTLTSYLSQNNLKIQYQYATETIKTVNLTGNGKMKAYEGTTYYELSSNTINPILYLEVPVVSTGAMTLQEIQNQD